MPNALMALPFEQWMVVGGQKQPRVLAPAWEQHVHSFPVPGRRAARIATLLIAIFA